jgi:hypothetical protein
MLEYMIRIYYIIYTKLLLQDGYKVFVPGGHHNILQVGADTTEYHLVCYETYALRKVRYSFEVAISVVQLRYLTT